MIILSTILSYLTPYLGWIFGAVALVAFGYNWRKKNEKIENLTKSIDITEALQKAKVSGEKVKEENEKKVNELNDLVKKGDNAAVTSLVNGLLKSIFSPRKD